MNASCNTKRILFYGTCVLDIFTVCEEMLPEDTKRHCLGGFLQRGGNASNNCTVMRQLGDAPIEFLGTMSTSKAFSFLVDDCNRRGINIENCPTTPQDPPFSVVILNNAKGTRTIILANWANWNLPKFSDFNKLKLCQYKWMHFEAQNPKEVIQMMTSVQEHNKAAKEEEKITISLDLEYLNEEFLRLAEMAHYVFLGKEYSLHMGWKSMNEAVRGLMKTLKPHPELHLDKPSIICPWGEQGSCCLNAQGQYAHLPAVKVTEVVDSCGAGDTFCAATIYALAVYKTNLPTAVNYGNIIAAYKLGVRGYDPIKDYKREPEPREWTEYTNPGILKKSPNANDDCGCYE